MKVFLIAALTADGFIGRDGNHLTDWTTTEDKKLFAQLTRESGVMVMGSRTFATIGRALPGRRTIVYTSRPLNTEDVETTQESPADLVARLHDEGAAGLAVCGGASIYTQFMQAEVVDELYLTVSPLLFGQGIALFNAELTAQLKLLNSRALDEATWLFHYAIQRD